MECPKIVLFDLDGTLFDNTSIVAKVYRRGLEEMGLPVPRDSYIQSLAGLSTYETGRKLGVPEARLSEIDKYFWLYFGEFCRDEFTVPKFEKDVEPTLRFLADKGVKMGIVTSNESENARLLLQKVGWEAYFEMIVGVREVKKPKPSREPIDIALEMFGFQGNRKQVWMVGDTLSDKHAAIDAGVVSIVLFFDETGDAISIRKISDIKTLLGEFHC